MKLHTMKPNAGATKARKRVGRGPGSGMGKTSTRGENGQNSRSGGGVRPGFEGGQSPLFRRLPKRGFSNARFKTVYATINLSDLNKFEDGAEITPEILKDMGLLKNQLDGVKVLGNGTLEKKLTVKAHKFSATAKAEIEKLGGKAEVI
jgi:large subunit ribosomal protein L15